ncbi:MAG TPA: hypothetical protein VMT00_08540 [Thermoanaerobaculia bacterium]|nr:hypothetical protein [Thermoanaerobaculia bacterium]
MKNVIPVLLVVLLATGSAFALQTEELVALALMPLAVAAVADVPGVEQHQLVDVVTAMNQARVPAPQFVEVVRYTPVVLVDRAAAPTFVTFVTTQVDRGVIGIPLATVMEDRLRTFGAETISVAAPPSFVVVERELIPAVVVTRVEQAQVRPLSLVAMPLAVAAVADLLGAPSNDLMTLVTALNRASIPPQHFVEIVRYAPVVLVEPTAPMFVEFVVAQADRGVTGTTFALAVADRLRTMGIEEIDVTAPRLVLREPQLIPQTVVQRVAVVRGHPHGGPPGQLKKDAGVQTGAEIVHGTHSGRQASRGGPEIRREVVAPPREAPPAASGKRQGRNEEKAGRSGLDDGDSGKGKGRGKGKGKKP